LRFARSQSKIYRRRDRNYIKTMLMIRAVTLDGSSASDCPSLKTAARSVVTFGSLKNSWLRNLQWYFRALQLHRLLSRNAIFVDLLLPRFIIQFPDGDEQHMRFKDCAQVAGFTFRHVSASVIDSKRRCDESQVSKRRHRTVITVRNRVKWSHLPQDGTHPSEFMADESSILHFPNIYITPESLEQLHFPASTPNTISPSSALASQEPFIHRHQLLPSKKPTPP